MKLRNLSKFKPAHWRAWSNQEKHDWCQLAIEALQSEHSVEFLFQQMNNLIGDDAGEAGEVIDDTRLASHAAFILVLAGPPVEDPAK